jgi:RNA polymerase sigma-70 factor, ECF subfamily
VADPSPSDGELLKRIAQRDKTAANLLFERYGRQLQAYVRNLLGKGGRRRTNDVVQEVWIGIHTSAESFKGQSSVLTWLMGIATNVCQNDLRKAGRSQMLPLDEERAEYRPPAGEIIDLTAFREEAESAIASLPKEQRKVFLMRLQSLTHQNIAKKTKSTPAAVMGRMHYAVSRLRTLLWRWSPAPFQGSKEKDKESKS